MKWSREEEIQYAKETASVPADLDNPYSVDQNLLGDVQMNVVSWKILGTKHQKKKHLEPHLLRKEAPDSPELLTLSLAAGVLISLK